MAVGATLLVEAVRRIAGGKADQARLGLTIVGFATAFELVVLAVSAARRGMIDAVVASVVGSFAYNATMTLGAGALARPLVLTDAGLLHLPMVVMLGSLGLVIGLALPTGQLRRWGGVILLAAYPVRGHCAALERLAHALVNWVGIAVIGLAVGFLAGLFGKGGSAIATPLLHLVGVPAMVAVAAPLATTIPSTVAASAAYWSAGLIDREVALWSVRSACQPRRMRGGHPMDLRRTAGVGPRSRVAGIGLRFLAFPTDPAEVVTRAPGYRIRLIGVAAVTGVASGLLANSGGFLLAPLYVAVLRRPLKSAFACSLAVAAVLAVPGTLVHAALCYIDWTVVAVFGAFSVPFSDLGARVALRIDTAHLKRLYGAGLAVLGLGLLLGAR